MDSKSQRRSIIWFTRFSNILDRVIRFIEIISVSLFALANLLIITQIIIRFIPGFSIRWTAELSRSLLIGYTFLGSIVVERHHQHMRVPIFIDRVSEKTKIYLSQITDIIFLLSTMAFLYGSYTMMLRTRYVLMSTMRFSVAYIYFTLFLCALFIMIIKIFSIIKTSLKIMDVEINMSENKNQ